MATVSLADIGKTDALRQLYAESAYSPVRGGSFTSGQGGASVTTVSRLLSEGLDFNLVYFPLRHLGYKSVLLVTGELLASLARPKVLSVVFGVSARFNFEDLRELWKGLSEGAREQGFEAVDLDLVPSRNGLQISISASGETTALTVHRRMAARSKDLLCVSGRLGAAYLGMQLLERGSREFEKSGRQPADLERYRMLVGAYLKPELPEGLVDRFEQAEIYPSYGYFLTRGGLADALKRLVRDSGLGAKVYGEKIPFEGNSFALGKELDIDPVSAALSGGDDCQLLFVVPILSMEKFRREFPTFDIIGHMAQSDVGAVIVTPDGAELPVHAPGWPEEED